VMVKFYYRSALACVCCVCALRVCVVLCVCVVFDADIHL